MSPGPTITWCSSSLMRTAVWAPRRTAGSTEEKNWVPCKGNTIFIMIEGNQKVHRSFNFCSIVQVWNILLCISHLKPSVSTTRFYSKKLYMVLTLDLCCTYRSKKKRPLLPYTLTDWLCITEVDSVYYAVRTEPLYFKQTSFFFKGLWGELG